MLFETSFPKSEPTPDFFSQFCHAESDEGEKFTDQEIIDHMIFLMMAAHDTTTSTLTSMIYLLAKYPDWQDELREISRAIGHPNLDFDEIAELETFDWVIKETLRMVPHYRPCQGVSSRMPTLWGLTSKRDRLCPCRLRTPIS